MTVKNLKEKQFESAYFFLNAVFGVMSFLILLVGFEILWKHDDEQVKLALRHLNPIVDLATENIGQTIAGVRESLRILSKLPEMRECKPSGLFLPTISEFLPLEKRPLLWDSSKILIFNFFEKIEEVKYFVEVFTAGLRRLAWEIGLLNILDFVDDHPIFKLDFLRPVVLIELVEKSWEFVQERFLSVTSLIRNIAVFIDAIIPTGTLTVNDKKKVEGILNVSLGDKDLIKYISVQNLEGEEIIGLSKIKTIPQLFGGWLNSIKKGVWPFYSGPVWFDESVGRPLWQMAVPLRDLQRESFGLLTAYIDLGFMQNLVEISRCSSSSYLFIVDEEGVIISHPKTSVVANQVNVSRTNLAVAEVIKGKSGFKEIRVGGTKFFGVFRNLKSLEQPNLPGWGIVYLAPAIDFGPSFLEKCIYVLFGVTLSIFVLWNINSYLIAVFEEEFGA